MVTLFRLPGSANLAHIPPSLRQQLAIPRPRGRHCRFPRRLFVFPRGLPPPGRRGTDRRGPRHPSGHLRRPPLPARRTPFRLSLPARFRCRSMTRFAHGYFPLALVPCIRLLLPTAASMRRNLPKPAVRFLQFVRQNFSYCKFFCDIILVYTNIVYLLLFFSSFH
jgi:hypothetical protein